MTGELVLAEMVRGWVERRFPDDPEALDLAVTVAQRAYRDGASVSEACQRAMKAATSRSLHPSYRGSARPRGDLLAS